MRARLWRPSRPVPLSIMLGVGEVEVGGGSRTRDGVDRVERCGLQQRSREKDAHDVRQHDHGVHGQRDRPPPTTNDTRPRDHTHSASVPKMAKTSDARGERATPGDNARHQGTLRDAARDKTATRPTTRRRQGNVLAWVVRDPKLMQRLVRHVRPHQIQSFSPPEKIKEKKATSERSARTRACTSPSLPLSPSLTFSALLLSVPNARIDARYMTNPYTSVFGARAAVVVPMPLLDGGVDIAPAAVAANADAPALAAVVPSIALGRGRGGGRRDVDQEIYSGHL